MSPKIVGICGGSCSGKTTLTHHIYKALGPGICVVLPQDDYFFGLGDAPQGKGGPNFDHPDAVDFDTMCTQLELLKKGQSIERPLYNFATHMPKAETELTEPRPIILVDGILILHHEPLRHLFDLSIFVKCESQKRFERRLERDVRERGRTAESVRRIFADQVNPMHNKFVEPSKIYADIIIENGSSDAAHLYNIEPILAALREI
ncbi:MAG: uridine kinase [Parasphingorhabdus sp.]|uniref:uridine kinase n=1 Tax=Parasphingorhabdus sp. TaxID=2709688 RepID=UPI0030018157